MTENSLPMQADIAQIISDGWRNGKSSTDIAEAVLREFATPTATGGDAVASDATCYVERSKVREILTTSDVIDNDSTDILLVEVDRLPIFVADDFRGVAATPLTYRWRSRGAETWIYDPEPEWLEAHKFEIEWEPVYGAPQSNAPAQAVPNRHTIIEAAIRSYCRRQSSAAVQEGRIYYAGLSITYLVNDIEEALSLPSTEGK